jgi:hypothetical protein
MRRSGKYAGDPEIYSAAVRYNVLIVVHQVDATYKEANPVQFMGPSGNPTGVWHLVYFTKSKHYDFMTSKPLHAPLQRVSAAGFQGCKPFVCIKTIVPLLLFLLLLLLLLLLQQNCGVLARTVIYIPSFPPFLVIHLNANPSQTCTCCRSEKITNSVPFWHTELCFLIESLVFFGGHTINDREHIYIVRVE